MRADFNDDELGYYETNDISKILDYRSIANYSENDVDTTFYAILYLTLTKMVK